MNPESSNPGRKAKVTTVSNDRKVKKMKPLCYCKRCDGYTQKCKRKNAVQKMICLCDSCNGGNWQCRNRLPVVPTASNFDLTGLTVEERGIVFLYALGHDISDYFVDRNFDLPNGYRSRIQKLHQKAERVGILKAAKARRG